MTPVRDADGVAVQAGDVIHFSYGIPPVGVIAPVVERNGKLVAITEGHRPPECELSALKRHVGEFWIESKRITPTPMESGK